MDDALLTMRGMPLVTTSKIGLKINALHPVLGCNRRRKRSGKEAAAAAAFGVLERLLGSGFHLALLI